MATGGAGTLYKSYTADSTDSGAQIWMCPYCVGSGYAMGFRQGAELTSLEQRWVATRTKDFCGPVDTISWATARRSSTPKANGPRVAAPRWRRRRRAALHPGQRAHGGVACRARAVLLRHHAPDPGNQQGHDGGLPQRAAFLRAVPHSRGRTSPRSPSRLTARSLHLGGTPAAGSDMRRMTTTGLFAAETAGAIPTNSSGAAAPRASSPRGAVAYMEGPIHRP